MAWTDSYTLALHAPRGTIAQLKPGDVTVARRAGDCVAESSMTRFLAFIFATTVLTPPAFGADASTGKITWALHQRRERGGPRHPVFLRFRSADRKQEPASYQPDDYIFGGGDFSTDMQNGGVKILMVSAGEWNPYSYSMTRAGAGGLSHLRAIRRIFRQFRFFPAFTRNCSEMN